MDLSCLLLNGSKTLFAFPLKREKERETHTLLAACTVAHRFNIFNLSRFSTHPAAVASQHPLLPIPINKPITSRSNDQLVLL